MKLKALLALTAALSFGGALAQDATAPAPVAPAITDVPAGHWAKDAVDELVSRRIIIGFPDGTFRGTENLTRYQAAVMIQRLLEQMGKGEVVLPTDPELLITLQNAVEELASDLAALGVRVADLEDNGVAREDFAALEDRASGFEDNLSDLTDRLDALEGMEPVEPSEPVDLTDVEDRLMALEDSQAAQDDTLADVDSRLGALEASLEENSAADADLQAAIDELREGLDESNTASDTALAQARDLQDALDTLTERSDVLEGQFSDLAADVESNTSSITALNDLTVLLNQDILDLQDQVAAVLARLDDTDAANTAQFDALGGQITDLSNTVDGRFDDLQADVDSRFDSVYTEIDGLRAFDDVIRRDVDVLTGRVTVNETRLGDLDTKVAGIDTRVVALERNAFTISGALNFNYYSSALNGRDFDLDRFIPGTQFSTGDRSGDDGFSRPLDFADFSASRVDLGGLRGFASSTTNGTGSKEGAASIGLDFGINFNNPARAGSSADRNALAGADSGVNLNSAAFDFTLSPDLSNFSTLVNSTSGDYVYFPLRFGIRNVTTNFTVGNNPLTLTAGFTPKVQFSDYVFDNNSTSRGPGLIAVLDGSSVPVIGSLAPKITTTFGRSTAQFDLNGNGTVEDSEKSNFKYYFGARAEITLQNLNLGLNYAREAGDGITSQGIASNGLIGVTQAYSADAKGQNILGINGLGLRSEFAQSQTSGAVGSSVGLNGTQSAFYARLNYNPASSLIALENLNYRTITAGYSAGDAISESDPATGDSSAPFAKNQTGFGVQAGLNLAAIGVTNGFVGGYYDQKTDNPNTGANSNDVTRFGALATGQLGPISIDRAYFNAKSDLGPTSTTTTDANNVTTTTNRLNNSQRFGVTASAGTFAGFKLEGRFEQVQANGQAVDTTSGTGSYIRDASDGIDRKYIANSDTNTNFRARLLHSGTTADALVKGLDLELGFEGRDTDYSRQIITARAAYTTTLGPVTIGPVDPTLNGSSATTQPTVYGADPIGSKYNVFYQSVSDSDLKSGSNGIVGKGNTDTLSRLAVGINASVNTGLPILDQVIGQVSYYNTDHNNSAATGGVYNANEVAYQVGVRSNQFLGLARTSFAAVYASYTGKNRIYTPFKGNDTAGAFSDSNISGETNTFSGYYLELNYFDLNVAFGDFTLRNSVEAIDNRAQAFRIRYRLGINN